MSKTIREAYGEALVKYAADNGDIVVLDADVSGSTRSCLFGAAYPERFFNVGIAEANMAGMAAGLAMTGKIPFVNTFATFISTLCLLSVKTYASYTGLNIKLAGAYGGLSDSFDGPTHHALEDIAVMRALPNLQVFVASDERQTDWLVGNAVKTNAPMYLRLSRDAMPSLYQGGQKFETGKGIVLEDGDDVAIFACGAMVGEALDAAQRLKERGISAAVIDLFCIKPMDRELVLRYAAKTHAVLTAEEHNVIGGLGSAVAEILATEGAEARQRMIGLQDTHADCGPYRQLMHRYGIDAETIAAGAETLYRGKTR